MFKHSFLLFSSKSSQLVLKHLISFYFIYNILTTVLTRRHLLRRAVLLKPLSIMRLFISSEIQDLKKIKKKILTMAQTEVNDNGQNGAT